MSEANSNNRSHQAPPAIENAIDETAKYVVETEYDVVTRDHLIYVLITKNDIIKRVFDDSNIPNQKISEVLNQQINGRSPHIQKPSDSLQYENEFINLLSTVPIHVTSHGRNLNDIKWVDIFYLFINNDEFLDGTILNELFTNQPELRNMLLQTLEDTAKGQGSYQEADYVTDLTKMAEEDRLDPVIGRSMEIQEMTEILARKKKNNIMLLGKSGVGKTAVVEGIAMAIHNKQCHESIQDKRIYILDIAGMLAGTKYRGEFEERAKEVLNSLSEDGNAVVFIDEAHTVMGAGASTQGGVDLANIMKPLLARGELMAVAATTYDEYKENIEKDKAMVRRFQNYTIEEPDEASVRIILDKIMPMYEEFHSVKYDGIVDTLLSQCERYIQNRAFPDKAIDILDAAGAYSKINEKEIVDDNVITKIVSRMSNVPEQAINKSETEVFKNLGDEIKRNLYGQDHVVDKIVEEVLISKSGMIDNNKPIGSFLISGTSGVGKTELARQLSDNLNIPLLKYDMSEYQESHSVSKLIGAPPGYVGYDENSAQLIDEIENNPNSVLLLDEIEKAHSKVLSILLQVMDDGKLTSSQGKTIKFNNVIILMTTNLGAKEKNKGSIGYVNSTSNSADLKAVQDFFSPEFLNRLSVGGAISFNNLTNDDMLRIVDKEVHNLNKKMEESKIEVELDKSARDKMAELGYDPTMGARPLQRVIKDHIKKPLSREIVYGKLVHGGVVKVKYENDDFVFDFS